MVKVAPSPGVLSIVSRPPCRLRMCLTSARPRPGAALRAAVGDIDAVEALGQPRQMLGRDAGTVVAHRHARLRRAGARLRRAQA